MAKKNEKNVVAAPKKKRGAKLKQTLGQIRMILSFSIKNDKYFLAFVLGALIVTLGITVAVAVLTGAWLITLAIGIPLSILLTMIVFSRRSMAAQFKELEGQPGAAVAVLESLRGAWRVTPAVGATTQFDVVHRVVGRPGIILVTEGEQRRVKPLVAQEKKKLARALGEISVHELHIGTGEDETSLRKLQNKLNRMPRNITPKQVNDIERRLAALSSKGAPLPKGPLPQGARMPNMGRAAKRRSARSKG